MQSEVKKIFDEFISETFAEREELRRFLLKHPRKAVCLDNLCAQIQGCERQEYRITFDSTRYRAVIRDVARMFCKAAVESADQQSLSSIEKIRRQTEANRMAEAAGMMKELRKDGVLTEVGAPDGEGPHEEADQSSGLIY